ncbi:MAG: stage III sporulation protein AG [Halanaerobiales bacterium]
MELIEFVKKYFSGDGENKVIRNIVLLGLIGTLFLFYGNLLNNSNNNNVQEKINNTNSLKEETINNETDQLKKELEEVLSNIQGVGKVRVQICYSRKSSYDYEYDKEEVNKITTEIDQNGGEREVKDVSNDRKLVIIRKSDGEEKPVISEERPPLVSGVIIIAEGAENSRIRYSISQAVSNLFELPLYKVNVLPYEGG